MRIQVPTASERMCEGAFMATSKSGGTAEARRHDSALTAARTFLRNGDPAVFLTAVGGDSTPYDDAAEETAVLPNSAANSSGGACSVPTDNASRLGRIGRFPAEGVRCQRVWLLAAAAKVLAESGAE